MLINDPLFSAYLSKVFLHLQLLRYVSRGIIPLSRSQSQSCNLLGGFDTLSAFDNPLTAMCRWSLTVTMMSYSGSETLKCLNQATRNNGLRQDQLFDNPFASALCLIF